MKRLLLLQQWGADLTAWQSSTLHPIKRAFSSESQATIGAEVGGESGIGKREKSPIATDLGRPTLPLVQSFLNLA
jgi:hypothetical protein